MEYSTNPVFEKLCKKGQLSFWDKKGIRFYPDSLFDQECGYAVQKAGQRNVITWYFDGETGKLIVDSGKLDISIDKFKDEVKNVVIKFFNQS